MIRLKKSFHTVSSDSQRYDTLYYIFDPFDNPSNPSPIRLICVVSTKSNAVAAEFDTQMASISNFKLVFSLLIIQIEN